MPSCETPLAAGAAACACCGLTRRTDDLSVGCLRGSVSGPIAYGLGATCLSAAACEAVFRVAPHNGSALLALAGAEDIRPHLPRIVHLLVSRGVDESTNGAALSLLNIAIDRHGPDAVMPYRERILRVKAPTESPWQLDDLRSRLQSPESPSPEPAGAPR